MPLAPNPASREASDRVTSSRPPLGTYCAQGIAPTLGAHQGSGPRTHRLQDLRRHNVAFTVTPLCKHLSYCRALRCSAPHTLPGCLRLPRSRCFTAPPHPNSKHRRVAGIPVPALLYYSCLPSAASRDLAQRPRFAREDKEPTPGLARVVSPVPERTVTKACCSWPCAGSPTSSSSGKGDQPLVRL